MQEIKLSLHLRFMTMLSNTSWKTQSIIYKTFITSKLDHILMILLLNIVNNILNNLDSTKTLSTEARVIKYLILFTMMSSNLMAFLLFNISLNITFKFSFTTAITIFSLTHQGSTNSLTILLGVDNNSLLTPQCK